jgi:PRTRC genetic system protein A
MNPNLKAPPNAGKFVGHIIASSETQNITAVMFEYLLSGNGLFIRARRREFSVCLPIRRAAVKGLPEAKSGIVWHKPRIPVFIWRQILENARGECGDPIHFREDVYVVFWHETSGGWRWKNIGRERSRARALADDSKAEYGEACIELHTHPPGATHFSKSDDRDEEGKFRIFGILIDVHSQDPKIRFRCGVYDHFVQIPARFISEMPGEVLDLNSCEQLIDEQEDYEP